MTTAKQVPELVAAHADFLGTENYRTFAGRFLNRQNTSLNFDPHYVGDRAQLPTGAQAMVEGAAWCANERDALNISTLFHISDSMTAVANVAAEQLEGDETWTREALPANHGVLVFEHPLHITDVWGRTLSICSATWHWVPNIDGDRAVIAFAFYTDPRDMTDDYNRLDTGAPKMHLGSWQLSHYIGHYEDSIIGPSNKREHWAIQREYRRNALDNHADVDPRANPETGELLGDWTPNMVNLGRTMYAIFRLMQGTVASTDEYEDRRHARRVRQHKARTPARVVIIRLRREELYGTRETGTGAWLTYRSVTRGYWRRPHNGMPLDTPKTRWVSPYMRGPEDAPIYQPTRVTTLSR